LGDQISKDERGRAWHIWEDNGYIQGLMGKLRDKDNFEETDFKSMIVLKLISMKYK
jgi:hypothetical protein